MTRVLLQERRSIHMVSLSSPERCLYFFFIFFIFFIFLDWAAKTWCFVNIFGRKTSSPVVEDVADVLVETAYDWRHVAFFVYSTTRLNMRLILFCFVEEKIEWMINSMYSSDEKNL